MSRDCSAIIRAISPKADGQFTASFAKVAERQFDGRAWLNDAALAGVLAHIGHETMGFTKFVENMNYTAPRICQVWPSRFPNVNAAMPYARNPEKLANKVYANRMGNGPPESGDGWR
jgi:putative chitinase